MRISLVVPVYNEEHSVEKLIEQILRQTKQPEEAIIVDGGSTDSTVEKIRDFSAEIPYIKVIEAGRASPGRGRNVGTEAAESEWIAYTDAGINLKPDWLERLAEKADKQDVDVVYGNYAPVIDSFFEKCATIAYVLPFIENNVRGKFIASSLVKKEVWEKVGGFPDLRAAEDLIFHEKIDESNFKYVFAPKAMVYWILRPNITSTFRKFYVYSKNNIWAGKQKYWHYALARQYVILLPFILLAIFHSWWWLGVCGCWIAARTLRQFLRHRYQFGTFFFLNPFYFFSVAGLLLIIDAASFWGWFKALTGPQIQENY